MIYKKKPLFSKINGIILLIVFSILCNHFLKAQGNIPVFKSRLNFEIGGPAGHYSLNYEKRLFKKEKNFLSAAVGFSPTLLTGTPSIYTIFTPRIYLQVKDNIKFKKNYFEFGLNMTMFYWSTIPFKFKLKEMRMALLPLIGFSRDLSSKFNMGIYFTPIVYEHDFDFIPWGEVRLGYLLK